METPQQTSDKYASRKGNRVYIVEQKRGKVLRVQGLAWTVAETISL